MLLVNVMNIKTNNQPRENVYAFMVDDATRAKLRAQFDYLTDDEFDETIFVKYMNHWYSLDHDFIRTDRDACGDLAGWDGYASDSFFSGVVVKYREDEFVIMGRYCC